MSWNNAEWLNRMSAGELVGHRVQLKGCSRGGLNGQQGTAESWSGDTGRYTVDEVGCFDACESAQCSLASFRRGSPEDVLMRGGYDYRDPSFKVWPLFDAIVGHDCIQSIILMENCTRVVRFMI
eukprot:TRINITY_DN57474_c0_g1_i1.p1 TRINITY_DN57474_c0_g1~~TRINITY_DN57474_c0_g1_i1.p1  ORF type:complete len:124 (-),score=4.51 TRINITY_DN57474_c0_g1_i1:304-675(-)